MTLRIRRCAAPLDGDELDIVTELHHRCMPHDKLYEPDRAQWWVAYGDGKPIGYAGARYDVKHGALFLIAAGTLPAWRGLGVQQRLVRARLRWGRSVGALGAVTYTLVGNAASANALIRCGFRIGQHWCYAGGGVNYWERRL